MEQAPLRGEVRQSLSLIAITAASMTLYLGAILLVARLLG